MLGPIDLFWFKGVPNFGDRISADIVAAVSGCPVRHADHPSADLFAIGSIMSRVAKAVRRADVPVGPCVWGTGVMGIRGPELQTDKVQFAAVRGPLTQTLLDLPTMALGDPGLLITDVVKAPARDLSRIGIVLHVTETPDPALLARSKADGRFEFIDVTDKDHLGVVRKIASCGHVISSSLHGLIVADAFGVPNSWMVNSHIHTGAAFKFHDYALAIRRLMNEPIRLEDVLSVGLTTDTPDYCAHIEPLRQGLRAAFPHRQLAARQAAMAELRAKAGAA